MMSLTKTSKERKTKSAVMLNNGVAMHKSASIQKVVKENKQDLKSDHGKQSDKNQPTAEQMRIAQIIDTKSEDPSLKDKLKQVMDATQRSADDAYTALHDSEYDANLAVNLILEGGNKVDEWSTSSKKKKARVPNEKKEIAVVDVPNPPENEDWSISPTNRVIKNVDPHRGVNRSRAYHKIPRGKGNGVIESDKAKRGRGEMNGPSRGVKSFRGGRQSGRGFGGFGRGGRGGFRRPFETWNQQPENQPHNVFATGVEEFDEYTGSLANSQVFTPSAPPEPTVIHNTSSNNTFQILPEQDDPNDRLPERTPLPTSECGTSSISPPQILSHFALQQQRSLQPSPPSNNKNNLSTPDSMLLESKGVSHSHAGDTNSTINQVSALCMTKNDYIYSNVGRGRGLGLMSYPQPPEDVRVQRINSSKTKPRLPPPSKIPSTAVEMPPDADSAIDLLDVQFGALEFGESSNEPVHTSPPSSHPSTPSPHPSDNIVTSGIPASESILSSDCRSYSPSPGTGSNSLASQISAEPSKIPESTSSNLYQDNVYHSSSLYTKPAQSIYNQDYNSSHSQRQPAQIITSNNIIYSTSSTTLSTYASSSSAGSYGNSSYPNYQYPNYPIISQPTTIPTSSSNSYQVTASAQQYNTSSQSVYGTSGLGTSSYNSSYPGYTQLNHKTLASTTTNSKEFETSPPSVNLNSISHSSSIASSNTLLSSSQTTPVSKPTSASTMAKGAVVASMPPGVPGLVGTHQYIVGQGGVPYFQQPPHMYFEDIQLMPQQRLSHHIATGYYEMGYQPTTTREGVQYNMTDGRFARADNTSPVQVTSMNQQSGNQAHQQPLINPPAMPPTYAYFYGGSMFPGNFQYGAPTIYPVAATGSSTGHGSSSSGVYGKQSNYTGNYTGIYDSTQTNVGEYKSSTTPGPKSQSSTAVNPATSSDIPSMYSKSHSALSKSYDKAGFHCPTPPPFNMGSQNSGIAPAAGGYPHLFIPTITPHHSTQLMHQPIHQESTSTVNSRSAMNNNPNKNTTKPNYGSSNYWPQN